VSGGWGKHPAGGSIPDTLETVSTGDARALPRTTPLRRTADGSRRGLVWRDRLVSGLVASTGTSIVLVVAPAGYGKTTLLSQWEKADDRPFTGVLLDERHNDPALLLGMIASALHEIEAIDEGVFEALSTSRPNISGVVVPRLAASIRARDFRFVLVLDDLHAVTEPTALNALIEISAQFPAGSQLVLASRAEPPLAVGRLRANRRLTELHAHDLVMTQSEASQLLRAHGYELGPGAPRRLIERTEGWPAGLYLAVLSLEGERDPTMAIERFAGDDRMVGDYVRDEFLSSQTPDDLEFLTSTSILNRLTGPLCDAVLEREGSANTLRRLSRSNLLLTPLDRRDVEYRYHALLREMLESELRRLGERRVLELHKRASRWYAEHGDFDRAVPHAIAAGDLNALGRLTWSVTPEYASCGREATLHLWLAELPETQIAEVPTLCLAMAACQATRGDGTQVERWTLAALSRIDSVPKLERNAIRLSAELVSAIGAARAGVVAMGEVAARSYDFLPEDSPWRTMCRLIEGVARHLTGDRERARRLLEEGSRRAAATRVPNPEVICLAQLALIELDQDDSDAAAAAAARAVSVAERFGLDTYSTDALVFAVSALVYAKRGRIEKAARHAKQSAGLLKRLADFSPWFEAEVRIVLARALLLLDDVATARDHLTDAARYLRQSPDAVVLGQWLDEASRAADSVASVSGQWPLTPAELRLLHLLPSHRSFREIAARLCISTNTVKSQAQSAYRKLGVSSRAEAVTVAEAAGLIKAY
jgi:LuxR family maltose regulon positive regulatory protein